MRNVVCLLLLYCINATLFANKTYDLNCTYGNTDRPITITGVVYGVNHIQKGVIKEDRYVAHIAKVGMVDELNDFIQFTDKDGRIVLYVLKCDF
jgi:hypothetical protein